jgi:hypothetical protein
VTRGFAAVTGDECSLRSQRRAESGEIGEWEYRFMFKGGYECRLEMLAGFVCSPPAVKAETINCFSLL